MVKPNMDAKVKLELKIALTEVFDHLKEVDYPEEIVIEQGWACGVILAGLATILEQQGDIPKLPERPWDIPFEKKPATS